VKETAKEFFWLILIMAILMTGFSLLAVAEGKSPGLNNEWQTAIASWYGGPFFGRTTANGETYTPYLITAAHRTLPFDTIVEICYPVRDKCIYTRVNDRGPWLEGREFDLSAMSAKLLGFSGVAEIYWRVIFFPKEEDEENEDIYMHRMWQRISGSSSKI